MINHSPSLSHQVRYAVALCMVLLFSACLVSVLGFIPQVWNTAYMTR